MAENREGPPDPVDDYFDRLDAAFSKLNSAVPQEAVAPAAEPQTPATTDLVAQAFAALLAVEEGEPGARPVRLTFGGPAPADAPPVITEALVEDLAGRVVERLPPPAAAPVAPPVITDALLEDLTRRIVERLPPPPAAASSAPPAEPVITDAVVEDLTRRVVERLAPDAVRAAVVDVVSEVAERLVREEIDRIRQKENV